MPTATLLFHGSLGDFLPATRRATPIVFEIRDSPGIRDVLGALGVPAPEVDLILANDRPVGFGHRLGPGDRIEVFGLDRRDAEDFLPGESSTAPGLIPLAPVPPRFVLDGHLGRLARYLRMLGFDVLYDRLAADAELARISGAEARILLTRDRGLLKRSVVRLGYMVRDDDPRRQLTEVVGRYGLAGWAKPFSRCIRCNGRIEPVEREEVAERLAGEPRTLRCFDTFGRCAGCSAIYWPGSHYERMSRLVRDVLHPEESIGENPPQASMDRRRDG
jgi:uncharacterized protein with PIN domain